MRLTLRDKLIIETLRNQEFCLYKDIKNKFFSSKTSASNRLNKLKEGGFLVIEDIKPSYMKEPLDNSTLGLVGRNLKIISLSEKCYLQKRIPSVWKKRHQLLLFSVREKLEKSLGVEALLENEIRDLKETLHNVDYEPLPDFYIKGEGYKLAVELELSLKSQGRYFLKLSEYKNSRFTHVLYVSTHIKSLQRLLRTFRFRRYIGITHFSEVETVTSHRYGKQSLIDWLKERTK